MADTPPTKRQRLMQQTSGDTNQQQRIFHVSDIQRVKQTLNTLNQLRKYLAEHVAAIAGGAQIWVWVETQPTLHAQLSERVSITSTEGVNIYIEHLKQMVRTLRTTEELKQDLASLSNKEVQGRVQSMVLKVVVTNVTIAPTPIVGTSTITSIAPGVASTSRAISSNIPPVEVDVDGYRTFNVNNLSNVERTKGFLDDVRRYIVGRLRNTSDALEVWLSINPTPPSSRLTTPKTLQSVERVDDYIREVEGELTKFRNLERLHRDLTAMLTKEVSIHIRRRTPTVQQQSVAAELPEIPDTQPPARMMFTIENIHDVEHVRTLLLDVQEHLAECVRTNYAQNATVETYPCVDEQLAELAVIERPEQVEAYIQRVTNRLSYLSETERMYQDLADLEERLHPAEDSVSGCNIHVHDQTPPELTWVEVETAFRKRITTGMIRSTRGFYKDPRRFLEAVYPLFENHIQRELQTHAVKVNTSLHTMHITPSNIQPPIRDDTHFNTKNTVIVATTDLHRWYDTHVVEPITSDLETFPTRGSGWTLHKILAMCININRYVGIHAGQYIQLPKCVRDRHAVVNVQSTVKDCFPKAIMAGLYREQVTGNAHRSTAYPHYSTILNLEGIPLPMELNNVAKFEQQNDLSIHIYALQYKNDETFVCIEDKDGGSRRQFVLVPIYISQTSHANPLKHVNLLLIQHRSLSMYHFSYIKHMSRLIRTSLTRHKHSVHVCDRCLSYFHDKLKFQNHERDCAQFKPVASLLPSEDKKFIKFKDFAHKYTVPFIVYADIECALTPIETCTPSERDSYTMKVNHHQPHSIAYYLHCSYNSTLSTFRLNCGNECIEWFVKQLIDIAHRVGDLYNNIIPLNEMTAEQQHAHQAAGTCHICELPFEDENNPKVRDHCHLQGTYLGAAHNNCNLNRKNVNFIPVVMHNLSGYDAHLLIKQLCEKRMEQTEGVETYVDNPGGVTVLATNMERYKGFTKHVQTPGRTWKQYIGLRFIDSFNFLHCSLDACARTLTNETMHVTRNHFPNPEHFALMRQKGVFPYEYVTHIDVLNEQSLPPRDAFHSILTGEGIAESEYARAHQVWDTFQCTTLREYSDLYLKADVLLLADIFENFRQGCRTTYGLDPAHYYTAPSLAWSALLKITGVTLELFTDIEMLQFVERGIRGGIVHCSFRHALANNKYMSDYNPSKPSSYLIYLDICNLYGYAMKEALPTGHFRWLTEDERNVLDVLSVADDASEGYIFEVDLHYPQALHDLHSDYPLCPHMMTPPSATSPHPKLMCTVLDKTRYVVHYRQLKVCVREGLVIERVHRVLQFRQSAWMKPYITINATLRQQAKTPFERNLYKLMVNSVFGRTLMNVRKMRDVKLVSRWGGQHGAGRLIAKPNFKHRVVFAENCMAVEMARVSILFDKPIYVGMAILDISKTRMCNFHYQYMVKKYPGRDTLRMCYTDTDSFIYLVKTDDVYKDIQPDIPEWFDTGDFKADNIYGITPQNGGTIGMMKDEMQGVIVREFIGLRPKMYAIDTADAFACRAKGVRTSVSKHLTIDDYRTALQEQAHVLMRVQHCIRSERHSVYTVRQNKIALSSLDNKRYIMGDGIATLPWGHLAIPSLQDDDDEEII